MVKTWCLIFASSSSSSEVGNLYWRLTRPFSLLRLEEHKMNNGCWINSPSVSWRCLAKPKIMTKGQPDAHKKRKNHAMATPCYTVYILVMKEYLKRANFLVFRILYRLSLATERERRLTTARPNQTTGLTNGRGTTLTPEVKFSRFRALSRRQMTLLIQPIMCLRYRDRYAASSQISLSICSKDWFICKSAVKRSHRENLGVRSW